MVCCAAGMHAVRLSFGSDAELEASTIFLKQSHPLNYTAAVKKSQVRLGRAIAVWPTLQRCHPADGDHITCLNELLVVAHCASCSHGNKTCFATAARYAKCSNVV